MPLARSFKELRVYQNAMDLAVIVFESSKRFPSDERYSLGDQIRRSSRSVAANISEAWRKRRYVASFRSKLNDAEAEACECQTHAEISRRCHYWDDALVLDLDARYEEVINQLAVMIRDADSWCQGYER
jgi:four helix bundle protein